MTWILVVALPLSLVLYGIYPQAAPFAKKDNGRVVKLWVSNNRKDILLIAFCWLVLFCVLCVKSWPDIAAHCLPGNDDYMRYVQFTDWLRYGHWYLEPMPRFNPEDGVIIHWSRLPDIPLAGVTLLLSLFFDQQIASLLAVAIIPCLYLLLLCLTVFAMCDRFLHVKYRFVGLLFVIASPAVFKFLPGAIDHHNLQLLCASLLLLLTPLNYQQSAELFRAAIQGLIISMSLWVGLENFIFFASYIGVYGFYSFFLNRHWYGYPIRLCIFSLIFTLPICLLNRPYNEFFNPHYDAISFPFLCCFLAGGLYLFLSLRLVSEQDTTTRKLVKGALLFVTIFSPLVIYFPSLIKGPLTAYPELLQELWLSNVSEARPILSIIKRNGIFSSENYLLCFIPALLYPVTKPKINYLNLLYIIFVINILIALLWQLRMINLCFILGAPIQAYVLNHICRKTKNELIKISVLLLGMPNVVIAILMFIETGSIPLKENIHTEALSRITIESLLDQNRIENSRIISGTESGSVILAFTKNSIVAAPYHRNISGNLYMIDVFMERNIDVVHDKLLSKKIGYILINRDANLMLIENKAQADSFIKKIKNKNIPGWLVKIYGSDNDDYMLFKVEQKNEL